MWLGIALLLLALWLLIGGAMAMRRDIDKHDHPLPAGWFKLAFMGAFLFVLVVWAIGYALVDG